MRLTFETRFFILPDLSGGGQRENPVFRITKKPPSETRVKNRVICHRFSMALNFHD